MSATHTPNLNLAKPDREDYVSVVADLNDNMDIIDAAFAAIQNTLRKVPISIAVGDWTLDDGVYYAEFSTAYITNASFEFVFFDRSYKQYAVADVNANKHTGGGGLDFETTAIPTGTITGTAYVFATNDGKLPVIIENTVIDIANGGTGQSSVPGVQSAFGIGDPTQLHTVDKTNLVNAINENADNIVTLNGKISSLRKLIKKSESKTCSAVGTVYLTVPTHGIFVGAVTNNSDYWVRQYTGGTCGIANYTFQNSNGGTFTVTHYWLIPAEDTVPTGFELA